MTDATAHVRIVVANHAPSVYVVPDSSQMTPIEWGNRIVISR